MRTFTSSPSRVLMVSTGPSTTSMVPRIRTGGGCWAQPADTKATDDKATDARTDNAASDATRTRSNDVILDMNIPPKNCKDKNCNDRAMPNTAGGFVFPLSLSYDVSRTGLTTLHRWSQAVA